MYRAILSSLWIIHLFLSLSLNGQTNDWRDPYLWEIVHYDVEIIQVWKLNCDSAGYPQDTILWSKSFYNNRGQLIETQQNFWDNNNRYYWFKYYYNSDGYLIDKKNSLMILDGEYVKNPPSYQECSMYENGNLIETRKYYTDKPAELAERTTYYYNDMNLKARKEEYHMEKLSAIYVYEYIKRDN
jgi:hypothetical protein